MYIYTYTHTYRQLCWRRISSYMDHGSKKNDNAWEASNFNLLCFRKQPDHHLV